MTTSANPAGGTGSPPPPPPPQNVTIISHSGLIYWWPVWLVGFILAGLTYREDSRLAVLPAKTTVKKTEAANGDRVYELTVPAAAPPVGMAEGDDPFPVRISRSTDYGVVYIVVILVVVFASHVELRGPASVAAVLFVILLTVVFAMLGWWTSIFHEVTGWHIQISLAGYLVASVALLILWLAVLFLYDPLRYMTFTPGQLVLHKEIGAMKEVFDTTQVETEKKKSDLFRQWFLGFGAGDLIIKIPGQAMQIELPNVLFADRRVREIANLMKMKPVIRE
jgi:hypothetical protein